VTVHLDDGTVRSEVTLDAPGIGLVVPPFVWASQFNYTRDAVLLVLASHRYEAGDYIRDYGEFLDAVEERRAST
jgi:UDP-2-acetamido-3-amino-2,3-dideoxy-glucuronate N-acetyltransferase